MEAEVASVPEIDYNDALVQVWESLVVPDFSSKRPALTAIADLHESHQRLEHLRVILSAISNGPGNSQRPFASN